MIELEVVETLNINDDKLEKIAGETQYAFTWSGEGASC